MKIEKIKNISMIEIKIKKSSLSKEQRRYIGFYTFFKEEGAYITIVTASDHLNQLLSMDE